MYEVLVGICSTASLAALGWAFHVDKQLSVTRTKQEDIVTLIEAKFGEVTRRLERIERGMNGHLKGIPHD